MIWIKQIFFFESVLNQNAECAEAYFGKLMIDINGEAFNQLQFQDHKSFKSFFIRNKNYRKAQRFGSNELKDQLNEKIKKIEETKIRKRNEDIYITATDKFNNAKNESDFIEAKDLFLSISGWKDADSKAIEAEKRAIESKNNSIYDLAIKKAKENNTKSISEAIEDFKSISGWKNSDQLVDFYSRKYQDVRLQEEDEQINTILKDCYNSILVPKIRGKKVIKQRRDKCYKNYSFTVSIVLICASILFIFLGVVFLSSKSYGGGIYCLVLGSIGAFIGTVITMRYINLMKEKNALDKQLTEIESLPDFDEFVKEYKLLSDGCSDSAEFKKKLYAVILRRY